MSDKIQLISPVDGQVYAERPVLSLTEAQAAVDRARLAQSEWAARPLTERRDLVMAGVKDTGRGASLSELGYRAVTRPKSFHLKKVIS